MTIEVANKRIVLSGRCGVEEAETLLSALVASPKSVVHLKAERIHTALWQVLLALKPQIKGAPHETFVLRHLLPKLTGESGSERTQRANGSVAEDRQSFDGA